MLTLFQRLVELLLVYKTSHFYTAHIALMALVFVGFFMCFAREKQIQQSEENPVQSKCSSKLDYVDYLREKKQNTAREVEKLEKSE